MSARSVPERVTSSLEYLGKCAVQDCSLDEPPGARRLYFRSLVLAWLLGEVEACPGEAAELVSEVGSRLAAMDAEGGEPRG